MKRPDIDVYFSTMAALVATRGSCRRRQTGCVLTNRRNHVLATGYNGKESGAVECLYSPCMGAFKPSGTDLTMCEAIHAEANALLQCKDVFEIYTAYCTTSPCRDCVKLLLNTSCERIVFLDQYPHAESKDKWESHGRLWIQMDRKKLESSYPE